MEHDQGNIQTTSPITDKPSGLLLPEVFEELNLSLEELRVAEEELRQQNEELVETRMRVERERQRYQELFDFAPDAYFVTDSDGVIQEANLAASEMLGIAAQRLVGKPLATYVVPEARTLFRTLLNHKSQAAPIASWHTTLRPRQRRDILVSMSIGMVHETNGVLTHLRWLVRERHPQEAEMEALIAAAPIGMALLTADLRCLHLNEEMARINGTKMTEHRGRHASELLAPETWRILEPVLGRLVAGETVPEMELSFSLSAMPALLHHYRVSCFPASYGQKTQSMGIIIQDITPHRNAQQQQERELARNQRIADTLQTALMQTVSENTFPGLSVATLYKAASQEASIGGDFYDAFTIGHEKVALVVGDVSGKGLPAATHIAEIKYTLRAFLRETTKPGQALARLNDSVCEAQRQDDWGNASLVVLALAVIDSSTGLLVYASAGAEPMLLLTGTSDPVAEHGRHSGMMLGVAPDQTYLETTLTLPPGGALLMTTDGITEARRDGEMLGLDGLKRLAQEALQHDDVGAISRAILDGSRAYSGGHLADDACLLLARRREG